MVAPRPRPCSLTHVTGTVIPGKQPHCRFNVVLQSSLQTSLGLLRRGHCHGIFPPEQEPPPEIGLVAPPHQHCPPTAHPDGAPRGPGLSARPCWPVWCSLCHGEGLTRGLPVPRISTSCTGRPRRAPWAIPAAWTGGRRPPRCTWSRWTVRAGQTWPRGGPPLRAPRGKAGPCLVHA